MKRKQIYLDEKSERGLKDYAYSRGVSEAWVVREALAEYLVSNASSKTSPQKKMRLQDNPLYQLIGLCKEDDGITDMAENVDKYLYDGKKTRHQAGFYV